VTGSVVTAGDAQLLLAPDRAMTAANRAADGTQADAGDSTPARHPFTLGELS
jgi:hypothetical protein